MTKARSGIALVALATALAAGSAGAQTPGGPPESPTGTAPTETADDGGLADIVVTARRVTESAQSTPLAVSAISGEQVRTLNIVRLEGITQLAPSLRVTQASGSANAPALFIRGIGTITTALYAEPSVGLYLDGVYTPRPTGATFDLPDIASIEVLRGPQGTLFGRNTTGGAILLNTSAPTDAFGLRLNFSYGSDSEIIGSGVLQTGAIGGSDLKMKFTAQTHYRDGWVRTPGYSQSEWGGALNTQSLGWATTFEPAPGFTIDNRARFSRIVSYNGWQPVGGSANGRAYFGNGGARGGPPFAFLNGPYNPTDIQYRDPRTRGRSRVRAWGDTLTAQYVASEAFTLKAIAGYSQIDEFLSANLGGGATTGPVANPVVPTQPIEPVSPHTTTANPGKQRIFTGELQALGKVGDFNYVVGLFYLRERTAETITTIINSPVSAAAAARLNRSTSYNIVSHSYAAFGQVAWTPSFADGRLEITGGLRYTEDKKRLDSRTLAVTVAATSAVQASRNSWNNTGWSTSISYKAVPGVMLYARAASAYRSGGYNAPTVGAPPFSPEKARSYEAGVKSDLFDRHVRINAAVYQTDYDDLQVNQFNNVSLTNVITNAGKARYRGFEVEAAVKFGGFQADANVGHVDPKYREYIFIVAGQPTNIASQANFAYVPRWTWHVGGQYTFDAGDAGDFTLRGDYSGQSNAFSYVVAANTPNFAQLPMLGRQRNLSARLIWNTDLRGKKLRFTVFGENLTDQRHVTFASDFSSVFSATFNRPRFYGASIGLDF